MIRGVGLGAACPALILTGCGVSLLQGRGIEFTDPKGPDILGVVRPDEGGAYERAEVLTIEWRSSLGPADVGLELYKAGAYDRTLKADLEAPTYGWLIPQDLPVSTEHQIVVKACHPQQGSGEFWLNAERRRRPSGSRGGSRSGHRSNQTFARGVVLWNGTVVITPVRRWAY